MSNKNELWLAFAGDELTVTVKVNDSPYEGLVEINVAGTITPERHFVYDLIMDVVENMPYSGVILNVQSMIFFSGHTVNDCAIGQILKLVTYFCKQNKKIHVQFEDGCVKDVFKGVLYSGKFGTVSISEGSLDSAVKGRPVAKARDSEQRMYSVR